MPLNTLRLNHAPSSHSNDRIVFIKPLPRPPSEKASYDIADTFLRAIAAQCLPIMRKHHLSVTTLEEHEENREFLGRNFNNGEIIQLVLRRQNGSWMPFSFVQMVMMHELAHNLHMNHSKLFWQTRGLFSQEMTELFRKQYTGEGLWGSGRTLNDMGSVMGNNIVRSEELANLPLCGGAYRSRRRKRKAGGTGEDLTWKEKQDRRIEKKFGKNGVGLGEDEDKRMLLEVGRKGTLGGKPRVAQSKRGRELRAAAALARFDTNKQEVESLKTEDNDEDDYSEEADANLEDAKDVDGERLLDSHGHSMIRVCDDEDTDDVHVKQEMRELGGLEQNFPHFSNRVDHTRLSASVSAADNAVDLLPASKNTHNSLYDIPEHRGSPTPLSTSQFNESGSPEKNRKIIIHKLPKSSSKTSASAPVSSEIPRSASVASPDPAVADSSRPSSTTSTVTVDCPICSMTNTRLNPTCMACAHVLDTKKDPRHWRCTSAECEGSEYVNAGDAGVCGVCGSRQPRQ